MNGLNPFDQAVMGFIQAHCHNPFTDGLFPAVTYLGEMGVVWIVLGLLLMILGKKSGWRPIGALIILAMLAGLLIGEAALKNVVCRARPFQDFPAYTQLLIAPPSGYSFPSGHSCSSFAAAAVLFCRNRRWGSAALVLAALIAFSRVFLFVHYPTDVLAGAALGLLCGLGTVWLYRRAQGRFAKSRS